MIKKFIYERVLYPVYQGKNGLIYGFGSINIFRHLEKSQWLSHDEIIAFQTEKLKRLIKHVYNNVPYYRDLMHNIGIQPEDIKNIHDLQLFPVLTKKEIKSNLDRILSRDIRRRKVIKASTGGTTGEPLVFYRDLNTRVWTEGALLRGWSWADYKIGNTMVKFTTDDWPSILGKIRSKLVKHYYYPSLNADEEILAYFAKIKTLTPFCLSGLSSNLYRIAALCAKNNLNGIQFPAIFSTAEMMYDHQRDVLQKCFKGKVYDYYGCNEIGSLAYECECNNKHITNEHVIIEAVDSTGRNVMEKPAEITITDLDNYAMPFIRYKNGDIGTLTQKTCECRRGLSILRNVNGRTQDFLKTTTGSYVPAIFFPARFRNLKGIERYQIIQLDVMHITLKIVKNQFYSSIELDEMVRVIKEKIGNIIDIKVEECSDIPLTGRGKTRLVISHVPIEF